MMKKAREQLRSKPFSYIFLHAARLHHTGWVGCLKRWRHESAFVS
jgi:hypothetical protein